MSSPLVTALIVLLLAGLVAAQSAETPYDALDRLYAPQLDSADRLAWPLKVKAVSSDPYKFWRGTKDLFFIWASTNCGDWFADRSNYIPIHADLHFGNIGAYAVAPWGSLALGPVDFDDACTAPFQLELLGGAITLKLVAQQNGIPITADLRRQLVSNLLSGYRSAIGEQPPTSSGRPVGGVASRIFDHRTRSYDQELASLTFDHHFRASVSSSKGALKEVFRPVVGRNDEFAKALADAVANDPAAAKLSRYKTPDDFRAAILDVAQRTRLGSGGSQGLRKYLVLLHRPLTVTDDDVILYLKQAIPAAAERTGAIASVLIPPGRRIKEMTDAMTNPPPLLNSWCGLSGGSYWVGLKEPWSQEIDPADLHSAAELLDAADLWGQVAGASHRRSEASAKISGRLSDDLKSLLDSRSDQFVARLNADYIAFIADPRVKQQSAAADAALAAFPARP